MIRKRFLPFLCAAVATLSLAQTASADTLVYSFPLSSAQEVPPSGTAGVGQAIVFLNDVTGQVTVSGSYSGLSGTANGCHIHGPAPAGVNAGILIALVQSGGTTGTISGGGTLSPANITNMKNGLAYVNVHTSSFGGGEIRGQVVAASAVPALSEGWVAALAALALLGGTFFLARRS